MGGIVMKQFNLEEYIANPNKKVITREGKDARIICTDAKSEKYQVVALVTKKGGQEILATFDTSGKYRSGYNSHLDLFFVSKKQEGWINIFKNNYAGIVIYETQDSAKEYGITQSGYVDTIKIEWEE